MKSHNCSIFLNVYVILIYVVTWRNEEWTTKSKTFQLWVIYIGIYKIGCNIYVKKCLLKCHNPSNLIYQKVTIERS